MSDAMVQCQTCGVFNDVTLREVCWKCKTPLPKQKEPAPAC